MKRLRTGSVAEQLAGTLLLPLVHGCFAEYGLGRGQGGGLRE
ncbi:MAG: hypothetical protein ACKVVO_14275 [Opitutaceae bacterium]